MRTLGHLAVVIAGCAVFAIGTSGGDTLADDRQTVAAGERTPGWGFSPSPRWRNTELEKVPQRGITWLLAAQSPDGGWGTDGGSDSRLKPGGADVANTALVSLSLLRAGATLKTGVHAESLRKAVDFVVDRVDDESRETRTQIEGKLGTHVDTFLGALLLVEVDGRMPDRASGDKVHKALQRVISRIERLQQPDGSFNAGQGWAPVIGSGFASRALHNAKAKGLEVSDAVLEKADRCARNSYNAAAGSFDASAGAGVELYQAAQALEALSRDPKAAKEVEKLRQTVTRKLSDTQFLSGLGSMGGEEFLSYLALSDSLVRSGGAEWKKWNGYIKDHLTRLQNSDGTWAGHHCITGRVACTAGAVLTLTSERADAPMSGSGFSGNVVATPPDSDEERVKRTED